MENRKYKQFIARMKYSTYLRLRRNFKALKNESAASYFDRLSKHLELQNMCEVKIEANK